MKKTLLLSVLLILAVLAFNTAYSQDSASLVGKGFVEVSAEKWLNSEPLKIADQKGKVVILEFWATWCPPCRETIPHLIELYNELKGKGVVLMAFTNEKTEKVEPFVKEMKMPYPIGAASKTGKDYGATSIPHAAVIDVEGKIAWVGHPMEPGFKSAIEREMTKVKPEAKQEASRTAENTLVKTPAAGAAEGTKEVGTDKKTSPDCNSGM